MTSISSLTFPSGKTLTGWWRQLAPHEPRNLWFAHLFIHRVEAPVRFRTTRKLQTLHHLTLHAMELERRQTKSSAQLLAGLESRLHLPAQAIVRILRLLSNDGLVAKGDSGEWSLTADGLKAKETGEYVGHDSGRNVFPFLERLDQDSNRLAPPHFLNVQSAAVGTKWEVTDDKGFDLALLHDCVQQDAAWKRRFAFPLEIEQIVDADTTCRMMPWQRVIVDRPERVAVVLALTTDRLLAFAVQEEGWLLLASAPLFSLDDCWPDLLPTIAQQPDDQLRQQGWQELCQSRGIPEEEIDHCELKMDATTLRVQAEPSLANHFRGQRDLPKDGLWTLVGDGLLRPIVRIKLLKPAT